MKALLKQGKQEGLNAVKDRVVVLQGYFGGLAATGNHLDIAYLDSEGVRKYMAETNIRLSKENKVVKVTLSNPVVEHTLNYFASNMGGKKIIRAFDYNLLSEEDQDALYVKSKCNDLERKVLVKFRTFNDEISMMAISVKTKSTNAEVAETSSDESDDLSPTMPVANLSDQMTSAAKASTNKDTEDINDTSEDEKSASIVSTKPILGKRAKKPEPIVHSGTDSSDEDTEIIGKPTNWMNSPRTKYMNIHDEPDLGKKRKSIPSAKMIAAGSSSASSSSAPFPTLVKVKKNKKGQ